MARSAKLATGECPASPGTRAVSLVAVGSALATVCIFAAIFTPLERLLPRRREAWLRPALGTDLLFLLGNFLVWTPLVDAILSAAMRVGTLLSSISLALGELPLALRVLLAWLTVDLCTYWFHRLSHGLPWLWRFHRVHHTAERLDWVAAYREHPLDNLLTRAVENLPLLLFGLPLPLVAGVAAFRGLYALYIHSNIELEPGVLRFVLGSPRLHHFHHDRERGGAVNYANLNPLFDLLFGTYHDPGSAKPRLGDPERSAPTYLGLLWEPLRLRDGAMLMAYAALASCGGRSVTSGTDEQASSGNAGDRTASGNAGQLAQAGRPSNDGGTLGSGGKAGMPAAAGGTSTSGGQAGMPVRDCNPSAPSPVCDFGLPCDDDRDCAYGDCYVPGTGVNAICAAHCQSGVPCPNGSACVGAFGGERHCFVACTDDSECLAVNDAPDNPLVCVNLADPSAPERTVCAQSSEP